MKGPKNKSLYPAIRIVLKALYGFIINASLCPDLKVGSNTYSTMKIIFSILTFLFSSVSFSQRIIEINDDNSSKEFYKNLGAAQNYYNIDSIQNLTEKTIRIWNGQEVFTFNKNANYVRRFKNIETGLSYLFSKSFNGELDSFNIEKTKKLDPYYYIDCFSIKIEIIENNHYFIKDVGCNKEVMGLINRLRSNEIKFDVEKFIEKLPSGEYQNYFTTFIVNQPIKDNFSKSNFYRKTEIALLAKGITIDNPTKQPLILINEKSAYLNDLNNLDETKIKSYKIITENPEVLFGSRAEYGVILISTKK